MPNNPQLGQGRPISVNLRVIMVLGIIAILVLPGFVGSEGTRALYGVSVECESAEHYVEKEQYTYYLMTIMNTGESEDTYNLTMDALPEHWQAELNMSIITIPSQESGNVMLKVKTTCECEFGEKLLLNVTATSESDPGIFDKVQTVTTYATVNIVLETQMDYRQVSRGGSYVHEFSILNKGSEEDTFEISVSQSQVLVTSLNEEYITLSTNTTGTVSVTISAPASAPYGYHELTIGAESVHNSEELESLTITVIVGEISLRVEDIGLSSANPKEGETATISFELSNTGTVDVTDTMITVHYLFKNGSKSEIGSEMVSIDTGEKAAIQRDILYSPDFDGISIEAKREGRYKIWEESLTPQELGFGEEEDSDIFYVLLALIIIVLATVFLVFFVKNKRKR